MGIIFHHLDVATAPHPISVVGTPDSIMPESKKTKPSKRPQTVWGSGRIRYDNVYDNVYIYDYDDYDDDDEDDEEDEDNEDEDDNVADDDVEDDDAEDDMVQEDDVEYDDVEEEDVEQDEDEDDNAQDEVEDNKD